MNKKNKPKVDIGNHLCIDIQNCFILQFNNDTF